MKKQKYCETLEPEHAWLSSEYEYVENVNFMKCHFKDYNLPASCVTNVVNLSHQPLSFDNVIILGYVRG